MKHPCAAKRLVGEQRHLLPGHKVKARPVPEAPEPPPTLLPKVPMPAEPSGADSRWLPRPPAGPAGQLRAPYPRPRAAASLGLGARREEGREGAAPTGRRCHDSPRQLLWAQRAPAAAGSGARRRGPGPRGGWARPGGGAAAGGARGSRRGRARRGGRGARGRRGRGAGAQGQQREQQRRQREQQQRGRPAAEPHGARRPGQHGTGSWRLPHRPRAGGAGRRGGGCGRRPKEGPPRLPYCVE